MPVIRKGKLAKFAKANPSIELRVIGQAYGSYTAFVWRRAPTGAVEIIHTYSRLRDARRRLKQLGYIQEGEVWRLVPKQNQAFPPPPKPLPEIAHIFNTCDVPDSGSA